MTKRLVDPQIEIARLNRDTEITREVLRFLHAPLVQSVLALVALETLQRYQLIGQNVSTAMEVAIATSESVKALVPAAQAVAQFMPGVKIG